ncbi:MAG: calcium/sodium antiporter, partial [Bacillota bacterium]
LVCVFIFLIKGADFFVVSSSSIAKKLKMSPLMIGMTLVAFGTSLPELAVSFISAITIEPGQTSDIAMGNVIGSNIVNITLILGVTAITLPIIVSKKMNSKELPFLMLSSIVVLILSLLFQSDYLIVWWEALILLSLFIFYMVVMIKTYKNSAVNDEIKLLSNQKATILLILGISMVSSGGYFVTQGATFLSTEFLVSLLNMDFSKATTLVGLSIVAIGTSLPELVTSVVAAKKGENEIAYGNLVGSNIFNIMFILGLTGLVKPLGINFDVMIDMYILLGITALTIIISITKQKITKIEGSILVISYVIYLTYIILRAFNLL